MRQQGFTLIELMIVVAIIGVLTAIAYPNFTAYLKKAKRADGASALLSLQQAQAKLRGNCRFYANALGGANTSPCNAANGITAATSAITVDHPSESDEKNYALSITANSATGYTAVATAQNGQLLDTNCLSLILEVKPAKPRGERKSTDAANGGGNPTTGCW